MRRLKMGAGRYKAAIVGCGRIASGFAADRRRKGVVTHAQAWRAHGKTELVAACDVDRGRLSEFGRRWGVSSLYESVDEMLRAEKPDFLSVCTWNTTHEALVEKAVRSGVKAILCEKPLADSMGSAKRMIDLCRKNRVPLLVNYSRRYNPLHQKIKAMIDRGELGEIQTVSAYYIAGIANTGTHLFDLLIHFFGPVRWVMAHAERVPGAKDPTVDGYLYFERGFGAALSALDARHYMQFEIDIYGTKGRVRLTDTGLSAEVWKVVPHPVFSEYRTLGKRTTLCTDFGKNLLNAVDNLVRVHEKKSGPLCDASEAAGSLEVALALLSSLKKKRPVQLPFADKNMKLESK